MQRAFVGVHEVRDRGVALGHPGALVEQVGRGVEIAERDFDQPAAERFENLQRRLETVRHRLVAEEFQIGFGWHADGEHRRAGKRLDCDRLRIGIGGILAGGNSKTE